MKILFIQPPMMHRLTYEVGREDDFFVMPLAYISITAALLEKGYKNIKIYSCPVGKIGWHSLKNILKEETPDIVMSSSDNTVYINEIGRLATLAKEVNPDIKVIVGGYHVTALPEEVMAAYPIDIIVRYEGEETIIEVMNELQSTKPNLNKIKGIVFRDNERIIKTTPRALIKDLDTLPETNEAHELFFRLHQNVNLQYAMIKLQSGRGCNTDCDFCFGWSQMGEYIGMNDRNEEIIVPTYRKKSVKKIVAEIEYFYKKYNTRYFYFVDDCFNGNPTWSEEFAEEIIRRKINIFFFAFLCADFVLRDEKKGILKKLVEAGLSSTLIGVERVEDDELKGLKKERYNRGILKEAFDILRKYPQVFTIASILVGLPDDSAEKIYKLANFCLHELKPDVIYPFCIIPLPGTGIWKKMQKEGTLAKILKENDYTQFDPTYPLFDTKFLKREELFKIITKIRIKCLLSLHSIKRGFFNPHLLSKSAVRTYYYQMYELLKENIKRNKNPFVFTPDVFELKKPKWYDS